MELNKENLLEYLDERIKYYCHFLDTSKKNENRNAINYYEGKLESFEHIKKTFLHGVQDDNP